MNKDTTMLPGLRGKSISKKPGEALGWMKYDNKRPRGLDLTSLCKGGRLHLTVKLTGN